MSKLSLVVLLAAVAVVLAPAASAQGVDANATLTIDGLPTGTFLTNETLAVFDFTVALGLSNLVCVGEGATLTVALEADVADSQGANHTAEVSPAEMTFVVPPTTGVTGFSQEQGGILTIRPDALSAEGSNVTATLVATVTGISGCQMASASGPTAQETVPIQFLQVRESEPDSGQELPGPALPLVLLALVALAIVVRRAK